MLGTVLETGDTVVPHRLRMRKRDGETPLVLEAEVWADTAPRRSRGRTCQCLREGGEWGGGVVLI